MVRKPLVITRLFDAPRERVWAAWTEPEQLMKWWCPKDFTCPVAKIDLQVGGNYHFCMHGVPAPGMPAQNMWSTGTYKEIVPMEKIVCTDSFSDAEGNIVPASAYGMEGFDKELIVTIVLEDAEDGKTKMTLTHTGLPEGEMVEMTDKSWNQMFDKLVHLLPS